VRLRISQKLWDGAADAEKLRSDLEHYLSKHPHWMWNQAARYRTEDGTWRMGEARPVLLSMDKDADLETVLRPSNEAGIDYLVVALRRARSGDRYEALMGRSLQGETFEVVRPNEKVTDVVVVIHPSYLQLPAFQKAPIIYAWDKLTRGLEQRKVRIGQDTVFWLSGIIDEKTLEELDNALTVQIGRVARDQYETKRARELAEKYGQACG